MPCRILSPDTSHPAHLSLFELAWVVTEDRIGFDHRVELPAEVLGVGGGCGPRVSRVEYHLECHAVLFAVKAGDDRLETLDVVPPVLQSASCTDFSRLASYMIIGNRYVMQVPYCI